MTFPLYQEIPYADPLSVFAHFHRDYGSVFLDSSLSHETLGRYSYIAIDPFTIIKSKNGCVTSNDIILNGDPFAYLNEQLIHYTLVSLPDLPPFQGGFAGYFGYELYQHLENIPFALQDDMNFPDMMLGMYDLIISFDNVLEKAFIVSSGFPEMDLSSRKQRAKQRMAELLTRFNESGIQPKKFSALKKDDIKNHFTQQAYCEAVNKVVEYISEGDIFQANISQRFTAEIPDDYCAFELYKQLRQINPSSFAAYLNFSTVKIISASPERFLKLQQGVVETRPIKGTRPRGKNIAEDKKIAKELLASAKDNAENVMIVDLMRNDLSRVCEPHSVKVTQLCGLESFATVHHLVSVVRGKLKLNLNVIDLLRATFPGGSITGAPKIRAMEIIAALEPTQRGPYCGSVGFISWSGDMDTSIAIRTLAINNNAISYQVGGAIVADSNPDEEYQETLTKGKALVEALTHE
ncbi:MAG: aminodeoxychorismate synthase component I [Gammaproteobacteria bacterium]|nr:aminodeoxychorismate synthase component I [Gammaproteobacteria bacterium]